MLSITALLYGALAAAGAILFEGTLLPATLSSSTTLILFGAIIEEGLKFIFLLQWHKRYRVTRLSQSIWAALLLGLGFALVELLLATPPTLGIILSLLGIHITTSIVLGYGIISRHTSHLIRLIALISAIVLHVAYNLSIPSLQ